MNSDYLWYEIYTLNFVFFYLSFLTCLQQKLKFVFLYSSELVSIAELFPQILNPFKFH